MEIFRMKGVLAVAAHARPFIVQAVHEQFDITESRTAPRWGDATETGASATARDDDDAAPPSRGARLVVIGRCLSRTKLESGLAACAPDAPQSLRRELG